MWNGVKYNTKDGITFFICFMLGLGALATIAAFSPIAAGVIFGIVVLGFVGYCCYITGRSSGPKPPATT